MADTYLSIRELDVPGALEVRLEADDLPHGRARETSAWEEGGQVKLADDDGTYLLGRSTPVLHVLQARHRPRVLRGAFRDRLAGRVGHARAQRDVLERVRLRANLLAVDWSGEGFTGFLRETKFGVEGSGDISYELTFLVAAPHGVQQAPGGAPGAVGGADIAAQLRADAAALRARQSALGLRASVTRILALALDAVDSGLADLAAAATVLEAATVGQVRKTVRLAEHVVSSARTCADAWARFALAVASFDAQAACVRAVADVSAAWSGYQHDVETAMRGARGNLRDVSGQARRRATAGTRLYLVREGDTLDLVAQRALGRRGAAGELGLTQAQLERSTGRYIRVPSA